MLPQLPWRSTNLQMIHDFEAQRFGAQMRSFHSAAARTHHAPDRSLEPIYLNIQVELDIEEKKARVSVTHQVRCNTAGARSLVLHGVDFAELEVLGDLTHYYDGDEIRLTWEKPFERDEVREVTLNYLVQSPKSGLFFSVPAEDFDDTDRPLCAFTDHETERARYWLATVDLATARPSFDITIVADARFTALSNGELVSEEITRTERGSKKHTHFRQTRPCPSYLTCFFVGELESWHDAESELPIAAFGVKGLSTAEGLKRSFEKTRAMIDWIETRLQTRFPYPKYYQFGAPFIGGAMENISLVSWDASYILDDSDLAKERQELIDVVNLHELAHVWFGDEVVCRDQAHAWLKESWATYMESVWIEETVDAEAGLWHRFLAARAYQRECRERYQRPIVTRRFDSSWDMYDYHLYPGGAWRIHMLRKRLGDDVFWPAVHNYLRRFAGKTAETEDFRKLLEEHSGLSLTRFFDEWIYGRGYPIITASFNFELETKEAVFTLKKRSSYQPKDKKDEPNGFAFDYDVRFWVGGKAQTETVSFASEDEQKEIRVRLDRSPDRVSFDPENRVLHGLELKVGSSLLNAMLREGSVQERVVAGEALIARGSENALRSVETAAHEDPHHGVRALLTEALTKSKRRVAPALARRAAREKDPRVLAQVFDAVGARRHKSIRRALLDRLDAQGEESLTPRARASALVSLAKQRNDVDFERLEKALTHPCVDVQQGAVKALAETGQAEAAKVLIEVVEEARGVRSRVRETAAGVLHRLLAELDADEKTRVESALVDTLHDEVQRVGRAAAGALVAAKSKRTFGDVSAFASTLSKQDEIALRRRIERAQKGDDMTSLKKRVERLEAKLKR